MTGEEAIEYWDGLRKTFSSRLEKEENCFGRMHLQTTIDALDVTLACLREHEERMWIPVEERLPEKGQRVIIRYETINPCVEKYRICDMFFEIVDGNPAWDWLSQKITHWYPMPKLREDVSK